MNKDLLIKIGVGVAVVAVIIVIVALVGGGGNGQSNQSSLTSSSGASPTAATNEQSQVRQMSDELLQLLTSIERIELSSAVFTNPAYAELRDITIPVPNDGTIGRRNPFAPIPLSAITELTQEEQLDLSLFMNTNQEEISSPESEEESPSSQ